MSAASLSDELRTLIAQTISQSGPLSFAEYMQLALYHPTLGYYNNGTQKFGEGGDFITAPEISPLFGQCIANQIVPILKELKNPNILEFGAGSGQLAVDILKTLAAANQLPECYYILELSAELQHRQHEKIKTQLPELKNRVVWLDRLPENFKGVVIANEVLDAMPIQRFCFTKNQFWQCVINYQNNAYKEEWIPATATLMQALTELNIAFLEDYHSEINLLLPGWFTSLYHSMTQGLVLIIDYGFPRHEYYHPDRTMGTLMCHYQHTAHTDPYYMPGLQDITAHVDFTLAAEAAVAAGFKLAGYTTQAHFLLSGGLMALAAQQQTSVAENWAMSQAIKKLILPQEMGELFKVMALTKDLTKSLIGFELKDMKEKL